MSAFERWHMCHTCRYSIGVDAGLYCNLHKWITDGRKCIQYEREPGADMPEEPKQIIDYGPQYPTIEPSGRKVKLPREELRERERLRNA